MVSPNPVLGIHHVTAISRDPGRTLEFYRGVLGLRLVKRTVNFDDPTTYHFYFGDDAGNPGSILTFFTWPDGRPGRQGAGQVAATGFAVRPGALGFWLERLLRHGVRYDGPRRRGPAASSEQVISFRDPDGLALEIVAHPGAEERGAWTGAAGIRPEDTIRGLHAVTLWASRETDTERILVDGLGFQLRWEDDGIRRFAAGDGGPGTLVDIRAVAGFPTGIGGVGTVHHVAWRAADENAQLAIRDRVGEQRLTPTPVLDRNYFRSIYFREPSGILFEVATDPPGFTVDEPLEKLGQRLMLPAQFETRRAEIEAALPPIPNEAGAESPTFVHLFLPADQTVAPARRETLLLLHGTGGTEHDLVPLGRRVLPGATILSPRGQVSEQGAARFFRRVAEGVFDLEDLARRTDELAEFVIAAVRKYGIDRDRLIAVGFSNGANIAVGLLLRHPGLLRGAVLLSPMLPYHPDGSPDLNETDVIIGAGRADSIAPPDQVTRLAKVLEDAGADVTVHWEPGGHAVTEPELEAASQWIAARLPP